MKKFAIAVIALAVLAVGLAMADDPVNQTYETQGFSTSTAVIAQGAVTNAESIVWTQSNQDMRGASLADGERQYTMSYSQSISGNNGYAEYNAVNALDTANKVANQNNFKSTKQFDYTSFDEAFGQVATSESLLLDGAAVDHDQDNRFLCPFATTTDGVFPAYCNIVEMGSTFSGVAVSMTTVASERHVANSADVPVAMDYSVGLSGQGAASAWIRAHLQEGRSPIDEEITKGMDLVYSEKTTASGVIASFSKAMSYQSGVRRF
ncbi:MAG: hypothetical protein NQU46_06675 [Methanolinea sp.]|nr:hypothetical protein [Methanolinea sp.]